MFKVHSRAEKSPTRKQVIIIINISRYVLSVYSRIVRLPTTIRYNYTKSSCFKCLFSNCEITHNKSDEVDAVIIHGMKEGLVNHDKLKNYRRKSGAVFIFQVSLKQ